MHRLWTTGALVIFVAANLTMVAIPCRGQDSKWPGRMDDRQLKQQGFTSLYAGESLQLWDVKPWHEGHWRARGDVIDYDGKATGKPFNANSLWTKESYRDLALYVEWKLPREARLAPHPIVLFNGDFLLDDAGKRITRPRLDSGDSGILLRGTLKCQANIWSQELGSGEVNGYRTDKSIPPEIRRACIPLRVADRPLGQWNAFLITLRGSRMSVVLNDTPVIDVELPDLPASGPIGLQHHGDPVQFRSIWVKQVN
jgi:hypothetical protein